MSQSGHRAKFRSPDVVSGEREVRTDSGSTVADSAHRYKPPLPHADNTTYELGIQFTHNDHSKRALSRALYKSPLCIASRHNQLLNQRLSEETIIADSSHLRVTARMLAQGLWV